MKRCPAGVGWVFETQERERDPRSGMLQQNKSWDTHYQFSIETLLSKQHTHTHNKTNPLRPSASPYVSLCSSYVRLVTWTFSGHAASGGALTVEPPRVTRPTPEYIRNFPKNALFREKPTSALSYIYIYIFDEFFGCSGLPKTSVF